QAGEVEAVQVVRTDQNAATREAIHVRQASEVARGAAVRPLQPPRGHDYRFVYCGALRARFSPYFLRSFILASRVSRPAFLSTARNSGSYLISARAMPCEMAPAWPLVPPPTTLTLISNLRCVLVTRSGASAAISRTRRPRYA